MFPEQTGKRTVGVKDMHHEIHRIINIEISILIQSDRCRIVKGSLTLSPFAHTEKKIPVTELEVIEGTDSPVWAIDKLESMTSKNWKKVRDELVDSSLPLHTPLSKYFMEGKRKLRRINKLQEWIRDSTMILCKHAETI